MSTIRRQSLISSVIVYIGFAVGLLNIYLFTRQGLFDKSEYGIYNAFIAIATIMMAFANLGTPAYINKFFPYYAAHLPQRKNDLITWALLVSSIGYLFVILAGVLLKDLVIRKFSEHAPEVVVYYNWIFVLGFGLMMFTILEAYAWQFHKSILTNFLREVQWRLFTTVFILLFLFGVIGFDSFIKLFAFTYPAIALALFLYLVITKKIHFSFNISKVTRRHFKNIVRLCSLVYSGSLILTVGLVFDSIVISSVLEDAMAKLAIYSVAQNMASLIQAPQRGIISASIAHLSKAWKEKDLPRIQRIYQRSSINQLIFSAGLYVLIVINFMDAITTFKLQEGYLAGFQVFLLLGAVKIVDMGTGVNSQIIGTSTYWKFEMLSGVILLVLIIPLNYLLTKRYDIIGPGIANLISISIYNLVRIVFLWRKFKLIPFTMQTIYAMLLAGICFAICYYSFVNIHGWLGLFARSISFCILYISGIVWWNLTPDILPVWKTVKKKLGISR
jgi:O-antigen/teichoic acid export membrane protein